MFVILIGDGPRWVVVSLPSKRSGVSVLRRSASMNAGAAADVHQQGANSRTQSASITNDVYLAISVAKILSRILGVSEKPALGQVNNVKCASNLSG